MILAIACKPAMNALRRMRGGMRLNDIAARARRLRDIVGKRAVTQLDPSAGVASVPQLPAPVDQVTTQKTAFLVRAAAQSCTAAYHLAMPEHSAVVITIPEGMARHV